MKKRHLLSLIGTALLILIFWANTLACSMYKVTLGRQTMVGCNEDAWRTTPHIWFETAKTPQTYGAAFTGSRYDGHNGYAPQSGMNEKGLVFSRLASYTPPEARVSFRDKKPINNPTQYLKDILHHCQTVEEAKAYISQYDYSFFLDDVFIYVDTSGKYLLVESFALTIGHDSKYVLANFCPSITPDDRKKEFKRYANGASFLANKIDTTLAFCRAVSDTMHVCRPKIGDGTLLTSIWNTKAKTVNLYFYHQYNQTAAFDLKQELAKGNHIIAVAPLFAPNPEFEKLATYKTPKNNLSLMLFLIACGGLFLFTAFFFGLHYAKYRGLKLQLLLVPLGLILFGYMVVLCTNPNLFYFKAPYKDFYNQWVTASSYIPFALLGLLIPLSLASVRTWKNNEWGIFARMLLTTNVIIYCVLVVLFGYWELYSFWS
ncbi:hypothetical protein [Flexibacter flexilis]|nr:hypothetical protein [Flexibacter flexilis]